MLVLVLTRRHAPRLFPWIVGPALGCILATMALRYHYVVDVAASVLLLPLCLAGAAALHRAWEGPSPAGTPATPDP